MEQVIIYTDGGVRGNHQRENVGGWGAVLKYGPHVKELYNGVRNTTNNRMEIKAVIEALKAMKKYNIPVVVHSDSAYVVNCMNNKWYQKWRNNGWMTSANKPVENREMWMELIDLVEKFSFITFVKVKGHSGNELNELADRLANKGMDMLS